MNTLQQRQKEARRLERKRNKITKEGTFTAINILQIIPLYILATEYGFGNVRLERFLKRLYDLAAKASDNQRLLDTMCDELEHDKGIRISFTAENNRAENVWRVDENDNRRVIRGALRK